MTDDEVRSRATNVVGRPPGRHPHVTARARELLRDAEWLRERLHDEGLSLSQVADDLGAGKATVSYWIDRHRLRPLDTAGRVQQQVAAALDRQDHERAAANPICWLHQQLAVGRGWTALSRELDGAVSPAQLRGLAAAHELPPPPAVYERLDRAWLERRYKQEGASMREMATEAGVHQSTIGRAMREAGVATRRRGPRPRR